MVRHFQRISAGITFARSPKIPDWWGPLLEIFVDSWLFHYGSPIPCIYILQKKVEALINLSG